MGVGVIVLLGVPRAGKTTTGREIAKTLKIPFYDLDERVVQKSVLINSKIDSPRTLVELYGEEMLRSLEKEEIMQLQSERPGVLSLGGGALLGEFILSEIFPDGLFLHISISFEIFLERILLKQLPATACLKQGWYEGLKIFYECRYEKAAKVCHQMMDGSCSERDLFDKILTHITSVKPT